MIAQVNSSWTVRVDRKELVEFQVDGTHGSAVAGLLGCRIQPRNATPKPVWNPDLAETHDDATDWMEVPDNDAFENGFKTQWEQFIRHVVEDAPHEFDFLAGARGVRLAEAGLESSRTGAPRRPARARAVAPRWRRDDRRRHDRRRGAVGRPSWPTARPAPPGRPLRSRVAYAAAHVVPRVGAENVPGAPADIDWDATLAFRRHVWSWGLGVADAMDTAQRNMGLDAKATRELIAPQRRRGRGRWAARWCVRGEHRPRRGRDRRPAGRDRRLRRAAALRRGPRRRGRC